MAWCAQDGEGTVFAVGGTHVNEVMIFDAATGKSKNAPQTLSHGRSNEPKPLLMHYGGWVNVARFAPMCADETSPGIEGSHLAVGGYDYTVKLFNAVTGEMLLRLMHDNAVRDICFSPDGRLLASVGRDQHMRIWDTSSGKSLRSEKLSGREVLCVDFDPRGSRLAVGGANKEAQLYMLRSRTETATVTRAKVQERGISWSRDDDSTKSKLLALLLVHEDPAVKNDPSQMKRLRKGEVAPMPVKLEVYQLHGTIVDPVPVHQDGPFSRGDIVGVAFSPHEDRLILLGKYSGLREYVYTHNDGARATFREAQALAKPPSDLVALSFARRPLDAAGDGRHMSRMIACVNGDGYPLLHDLNTSSWHALRVIEPDHERSNGANGEDALTKHMEKDEPTFPGVVRVPAVCIGERAADHSVCMAVADTDSVCWGEVDLSHFTLTITRRVTTNRLASTFEPRTPSFDIARDGAYVAIAANDAKLRLFDSKSGDELAMYDERYPVQSVHFVQGPCPGDPPMIASGGRGSFVNLRDVGSGALILKWEVKDWVTQICCPPAGGQLVVMRKNEKELHMYATPLDTISESVIAFWAKAFTQPRGDDVPSPPGPGAFLKNEALFFESSPSGRTLLTHATACTDTHKRSAQLPWIRKLIAAQLGVPIPSIVRRDIHGKHALDYALLNHDFDALQILLKGVKKLPPRARDGLVQMYAPPSTIKVEDGRPKYDKDISKCDNFLTKLATDYPMLCRDLFKDLDLDEYENFEDAPTVGRVRRNALDIELIDKSRCAMFGRDRLTGTRTEIWEEHEEKRKHKGYFHLGEDEVEDLDVEFRLVGIRGLCAPVPHKGSAQWPLAGGLTFSKIVEQLMDMDKRGDQAANGLIVTPAMQSVIEYKWEKFAYRRWRDTCLQYGIVLATFVVASFLLELDGFGFYEPWAGIMLLSVSVSAQLVIVWNDKHYVRVSASTALLKDVLDGFTLTMLAGLLALVLVDAVMIELPWGLHEWLHGVSSEHTALAAVMPLHSSQASVADAGGRQLRGDDDGDDEAYMSTGHQTWMQYLRRVCSALVTVLLFFRFMFISRGSYMFSALTQMLSHIKDDRNFQAFLLSTLQRHPNPPHRHPNPPHRPMSMCGVVHSLASLRWQSWRCSHCCTRTASP